MKELLRFMYAGCVDENDSFGFLLLGLLNLLMWLVTLSLVLMFIDFSFKTDFTEDLQLKNKVYHEDYYYTVLVGKVPTMMYSPERFEFIFDKVSCDVTENNYDKYSVGHYLTVEYYKGVSTTTYCVSTGK